MTDSRQYNIILDGQTVVDTRRALKKQIQDLIACNNPNLIDEIKRLEDVVNQLKYWTNYYYGQSKK